MLSEVTYTCEYCHATYKTRKACEKCEESHSHNATLHKKLENALATSTVYYNYDNQLSIMRFYKIEHLCENTTLPECILRVKSLEIRLNRVFDWYGEQVLDAFKTTYFIANIEDGVWAPITKTSKIYKDTQQLIKLKEQQDEELSQNELFKKYNLRNNPYQFNISKVFSELFINKEDVLKEVQQVDELWKNAQINQ